MSLPHEGTVRLASAAWLRRERIVQQFEEAWRNGERPAPTAFLPAGASLRRALLVELLHTELEFRLEAGEEVRVETYLAQYPELADDAPALLDLIAAEYELRRRRRLDLTVDEYQGRFPQLATDLQARLAPGPLNDVPTRQRPQADQDAAAVTWPRIPGYTILDEVGRGGMGVVYRARQEGLGRVVALKMIRPAGQSDPEDLARFRTEAEAVARLQHPNIVQIHDVGEENGQPYFAMEYVAGGSLVDRLDGAPQSPRSAALVTETLARAIHHAHQHGVIHRDLKPANVLIADCESQIANCSDPLPSEQFAICNLQSAIKVADFGLAKRFDTDLGQTRSGAILGTPGYMAPEQAAGLARESGPAADVYALGSILYELLTGRPPFQGTTVLDILEQVRSSEPVPPRRLLPKVPRDLETVCLKCLQKGPPRRYASAEALADDLARFLRGEAIQARPVGRIEKLGRWCRRNPLVATLTGLTLAAILVGFAAVAWQWRRAERNFAASQEQQHRAEANFAWAQEAVEELLTQAAEGMADVPQMDPVRRQLLTRALALHERFLDQKSDNPSVRLETARAHRRMGELYDLLGEPERAEQALRVGLSLLGTTASPGPVERDRERGRLLLHLGRLRHQAGQLREAEEEHYREALEISDRLLAARPGDPAVLLQAAEGLQHLGNVLQGLARFDDAETAYREILRHLDELPPGSPDPQARRIRGSVLNSLGGVSLKAGRFEDAEKAFLASGAVWRQLEQDFPGQRSHRRNLAGSHGNLAGVYAQSPRFRLLEALTAYHQVLEIEHQLVKDFPNVPTYREKLADTYNNLGVLHRRLDNVRGLPRHRAQFGSALVFPAAGPLSLLPVMALKPDEPLDQARRAYLTARQIQSGLVADYPGERSYRHALALSLVNLGNVSLARKDLEEGQRSLVEAGNLFRQLVAEFPEEPDYASGLGMALMLQAGLEEGANRWAVALELHRRALEHHLAAVRLNAKHAEYRRLAGVQYGLLANNMITQGQDEEAARMVEQFLLHHPPAALASHRAALLLAACIAGAEKDSRSTIDQRRDRARAHGDRAIALLRQSIDQGLRDARMLKGPPLDPLREREDFQKLLRMLEAKGGG